MQLFETESILLTFSMCETLRNLAIAYKMLHKSYRDLGVKHLECLLKLKFKGVTYNIN